MRFTLLAIAATALCGPLAAQQTVHCSAQQQPRNFCAADTHNGVLLLHENSNGACHKGTTWIETASGIRVTRGCDADFLINSDATGNTDARFGNGDNNGRNGNQPYGDNRNNQNGSNSNQYGNNSNNGYNNQSQSGQNTDNRNNGQNGYSNNNGYATPPQATRRVILPAGTDLVVRLEQAVRPSQAAQGSVIAGKLASDLIVQGTVVAPAGTSVLLKVNSQQNQQLDLRLDSLTLGSNTYQLRSTSIHSLNDSVNGNQQAQNQQGGLGGFLNQLEGGPDIPRGTEFHLQLVQQAEIR